MWNVGQRLDTYFQYKANIDVQVIYTNTSPLPAVTICNQNNFRYVIYVHKLDKQRMRTCIDPDRAGIHVSRCFVEYILFVWEQILHLLCNVKYMYGTF